MHRDEAAEPPASRDALKGGFMNRWASVSILVALLLAASCSTQRGEKGGSPSADPFVGFFAHPSSGLLELNAAGEGKYRGPMWADFGTFPVEGTRDGHVVRGTVTYGGAAHPPEVESTPQGLVPTADGTRAEAPLRRYKDMKAYEKWFRSQGGYQAEIEVDPAPETQPAQ